MIDMTGLLAEYGLEGRTIRCRRNSIRKRNTESMSDSKIMQLRTTLTQDIRFFIIAGTGLFADGYLNTTIGLVIPMLGYLYWPEHGSGIPTVLRDTMKGSLSLGMILGQVLFGLGGDTIGRRRLYGKELLITMLGTLLVVLLPWHGLSQHGVTAWVSCFRVLTGIGIGADYPMSSTLSAETPRRMSRGKVVLTVFSSIGLGTITAGIVYLILLEAFKDAIMKSIHNLEWVWRLLLGIGLVPCAATVYARLTMVETSAYKKFVEEDRTATLDQPQVVNQLQTFKAYFCMPRHAVTLFATAAAWFLFDIAFYGIGLNQSVILGKIGYGRGNTPYQTLHNTAVGNLIALSAGNLPGYYIGIFLPDLIGRVRLQIIASMAVAVLYAIWAGITNHSSVGGLMAIFATSQLVLNLGPNVTTFLLPVEVVPTRLRASTHGIAAASGKVGAVLTAFAFGTVTNAIGIQGVLGVLAGVMVLTAAVSSLIPEPKEQSLDDIENDKQYKQRSSS